MGLETTAFWYCDWHASRDIDRANEATGDMEAPEPIELPPLGWGRVDVRIVRTSEDTAKERAQFRADMREMLTAQSDEPVTEAEVERMTEIQIRQIRMTDPTAFAPTEVIHMEAALAPDKLRWLALAGIPGTGADPTKVWGRLAEALTSAVEVPPVDTLAQAFADAYPDAPGWDDLDEAQRERVRVAMRAVTAGIQATISLPRKGLEAAVDAVLNTSPETEDEDDE